MTPFRDRDHGTSRLRAALCGIAAALSACSALSPSDPALARRTVPPQAVAAPSSPLQLPAAAPVVAARQFPPAAATGRLALVGRERLSRDARDIANWVVYTGDNRGLPFIVVDKAQARVLVFGADGRLRGSSAALLGSAHGDDSVPGIGERPIAEILPEERTTPAGRFVAELGQNATGEDILWVDYDNAISMHRVRATVASERRLQRLASPTPDDNRISYGCINLPIAFYDHVVKPAFEPANGIVYVLPETRSALALFGAYPVSRVAAGSRTVSSLPTR